MSPMGSTWSVATNATSPVPLPAVAPPCYINDTLTFDPTAPSQPTPLGTLPAALGGGHLTISVWIFAPPRTENASWGRVVDLGTRYGGPGDNILLTHVDTSGHLGYQVYVGNVQKPTPLVSSVDPIPTAVWLRVVAIQSGTTASIYWGTEGEPLEQQATGTVLVPAALPRASSLVGQSNWPGDAAFSGQIRGLRIFDRVLTMDELVEVGDLAAAELSLCRPAPPPPSPAPPGPPQHVAFTLNLTQPGPVVDPEIFGHDLEFTRHDIFEGLSAEVVANRKFAVTSALADVNESGRSGASLPRLPAGYLAPRWRMIGTPALDAPMWSNNSHLVTGDRGHSVRCAVQAAACGVEQSQVLDGFNSGMSRGSAIVLRGGGTYAVRVALRRAVGSGPQSATASLLGEAGAPLWTETFALSTEWQTFTANFSVKSPCLNATLQVQSQGPTAVEWWIGTVSITEIANTWRGMRKDVVASLNATGFHGLLRYPGGCFAPFYRWKVGLLEPDMRPPIETPAGNCAAVPGGINAYTDQFLTNGVGIDDFMALSSALGLVPAITIRLQLGDDSEVTEAADWVHTAVLPIEATPVCIFSAAVQSALCRFLRCVSVVHAVLTRECDQLRASRANRWSTAMAMRRPSGVHSGQPEGTPSPTTFGTGTWETKSTNRIGTQATRQSRSPCRRPPQKRTPRRSFD
jgi:hypothetical protein